ncbi:MAG: signal peptidase II [Malacoplasma sp.]
MNIKQSGYNFIAIYEYIKSIYKSKYLFKKLFIFFGIGILVLTASFVSRQLALESHTNNTQLIPGFITINIIGNTGISFSFLKDAHISLILFIQFIPVIIAFCVILLSRNIVIDISFSFMFFGGLSNIIDRCIVDDYKYINILENTNAVVDYLQFSFIKNSAIFNVPDIFIVLSSIIVITYLVVSSLILFTTGKHKSNKDNDHLNDETKKEQIE